MESFVKYEGYSVRVRNDAATVLKIISLCKDDDVPMNVKAEILMRLLFVDFDAVLRTFDNPTELVTKALSEVAGMDMDSEDVEPIIDFDEDKSYINASMWATYGEAAQSIAERTTFREFCSLVSLCPHETPIGQALFYRTAKEPKHTNGNSDEIARFRRSKAFWGLKHVGEDKYTAMNRNASDAAASILRMARLNNG